MAAKRGGGRIKTVVYLDVLLLTNFLTAYLLLLAAGALSGQRAPFARMLVDICGRKRGQMMVAIRWPPKAGLYGCPCLYLMPRTNHDKNKFVLLKRKFEPYWIDKYYQKGGKLYE